MLEISPHFAISINDFFKLYLIFLDLWDVQEEYHALDEAVNFEFNDILTKIFWYLWACSKILICGVLEAYRF